MGVFGIEIGGEGPGDYAADGIGAEAEQAVDALLKTLEALGFTITFSAVMAPQAVGPLTLAGEAQLPVDEGAFKCPDCGLAYRRRRHLRGWRVRPSAADAAAGRRGAQRAGGAARRDASLDVEADVSGALDEGQPSREGAVPREQGVTPAPAWPTS